MGGFLLTAFVCTLCCVFFTPCRMTGVQEVGVQGEAFDPNLHEAVMREDRDDVEDGTVTCVFQKGYRLGDILVRPALVKVAYS